MDRLMRERLKKRRKIFIRCLIFILLAALLFWGIRLDMFFKKPQVFKDTSWWLDFAGHFFVFFIVGFLAIYESRLILHSSFRRWRSMFMECLGWGAAFEIFEFLIDQTRFWWFSYLADWFSNIDTLQKGNEDTMYDLIADGGGVLTAMLLWIVIKAIYAWLFPSEARAEYLAERAELVAHQREEARKLEKEYLGELRKGLKSKITPR